MVNEFRLAYNRFSPFYNPINGFSLADLGGNYPVVNGVKIPPNIVAPGRFTVGAGSSVYSQIENEVYQITDILNWTRDSHSVKAGFDVSNQRYINHTYGAERDPEPTPECVGNLAAARGE